MRVDSVLSFFAGADLPVVVNRASFIWWSWPPSLGLLPGQPVPHPSRQDDVQAFETAAVFVFNRGGLWQRALGRELCLPSVLFFAGWLEQV